MVDPAQFKSRIFKTWTEVMDFVTGVMDFNDDPKLKEQVEPVKACLPTLPLERDLQRYFAVFADGLIMAELTGNASLKSKILEERQYAGMVMPSLVPYLDRLPDAVDVALYKVRTGSALGK